MNKQNEPFIDQKQLADAWNRTLPATLNESDQVEVKADEADAKALRIHIITAGRSGYTFDFKCTYVDSREVKVEFIDVEQGNQAVNEEHENIQALIEDYVRHIHECAQMLHTMTNH